MNTAAALTRLQGDLSYSYWAKGTASGSPVPEPKKLTDAEKAELERQASAAGASAWNAAGTFEERGATKWAHGRLAELLRATELPEGVALTDVTKVGCRGVERTARTCCLWRLPRLPPARAPSCAGAASAPGRPLFCAGAARAPQASQAARGWSVVRALQAVLASAAAWACTRCGRDPSMLVMRTCGHACPSKRRWPCGCPVALSLVVGCCASDHHPSPGDACNVPPTVTP
jgi:hypothetical protein